MEFLKELVEQTRKRKGSSALFSPQSAVLPKTGNGRVKEAEGPLTSDDTRSDTSEQRLAKRGRMPCDSDGFNMRKKIEYDEYSDEEVSPTSQGLSLKHVACVMQSAVALKKATGGFDERGCFSGGAPLCEAPLPLDLFRAFIQEKKRNIHLIASLASIEKEIKNTMNDVYEKLKRHDKTGIKHLLEYIQYHSTINNISWRNETNTKNKCTFNAKVNGYYVIQIKSDPLSAFLKALREGRARADVYSQFSKDFMNQEYIDPDVPVVRYVRVSREKLVEVLALVQFNSYRLISSDVYTEENLSAEEILEKFKLLKNRIDCYSFMGLRNVDE